MEIAVIILSALSLIVSLIAVILITIFSVKFSRANSGINEKTIEKQTTELKGYIELSGRMSSNAVFGGINSTSEQLVGRVKEMGDTTAAKISEMREEMARSLSDMRSDLRLALQDVRQDNAKQLEEMRSVVDEKLSKTLNDRLNQSFQAISSNIEMVIKGLKDISALSGGVSDLNKVLNNVKTRGSWGEISLEAILSEILTPEQYQRNSTLGRKGVSEKNFADFAIILPGADNEKIFLPIDSKFPVEDYLRMNDAYAEGKVAEAEEFRKKFIAKVKEEARSIRTKYINPPKTTDFAIMYLPVEGLYAEILRQSGLVEELQSTLKIVPAGPANIAAMLNSLKMGFKTLAIQKSSAEVFKILSTFRTEFGRFKEIVSKAQGYVQSASDKLTDAYEKTTKIDSQLAKIERLDIHTEETPPLIGE